MSSVAVVVLTFNEEPNLAQALNSVVGWADEVFVLDSYSTDATTEIARGFGCTVLQHPFVDHAAQRNYALEHLPILSEWVLFLDADEWLPDALKHEIRQTIDSEPVENGFFVKWRMIWMGGWIRRGYYPTWLLRLFRRGKGHFESRAVNEHPMISGTIGYLRNDFFHQDHKGITEWISKHNYYATREAQELVRRRGVDLPEDIGSRLFGTQTQRKRWLRHRVWERLPPLIRPFLYFLWRYVLRGGFLDGRRAFIYHFLQGLWFPLLIDIKYLELMAAARRSEQGSR